MKKIKYLSMLVIAGMITIAMSSCNDDCSGEDPRARILNNGTDKASVQIKTSGGNTVNINNVDPATSSPYSSYAPGQIEFTITVKNTPYLKVVDMTQCNDYDIAIDSNNLIMVTVINRD